MRSTPRQMEGPYYPEADRDRDNDLTTLGPGKPRAAGEIIHLAGTVHDGSGAPVAGARVELWQANAAGRYNHSQDPSAEPLDPHFQYWGRDLTDGAGRFRFKTIIPGRYLDGADYRPPHLHTKVTAPGFFHLTTQIYFDPRTFADAGVASEVERLNQLERIPADLLVHFRSQANGEGEGEFTFYLKPQRSLR